MDCFDQRYLHGAVGGEEAGVLAVLGDHLRNVFQDEHLGAGDTSVRGGVGSGGIHKFDAQLFALGLDQVAAAGQRGLRHVAGEAVVHEGLAAHVIGLLRNGGTLVDLVDGDDDVGTGYDVIRILLRRAVDDQQVVLLAALQDLVDGGVGAGAGLVDDDGLIGRVCAVLGNDGDKLLLLGHEVVGHQFMHDQIAELFGHGFRGTEFFFVLGYGVSDDGNFAAGEQGVFRSSFFAALIAAAGFLTAGRKSEHQGQSQQ